MGKQSVKPQKTAFTKIDVSQYFEPVNPTPFSPWIVKVISEMFG